MQPDVYNMNNTYNNQVNPHISQGYKVVPRPKPPVDVNEVRVAQNGKINRYCLYAYHLFNEDKLNTIVVKGIGNAIPMAVRVVEKIKCMIPSIYQHNTLGSTVVRDTYEAIDKGLSNIVREKNNVPFLYIHLSIDKDSIPADSGFQGLADQSLVRLDDLDTFIRPVSYKGGKFQNSKNNYRGDYKNRPSWEMNRKNQTNGDNQYNAYNNTNNNKNGKFQKGIPGQNNFKGRNKSRFQNQKPIDQHKLNIEQTN